MSRFLVFDVETVPCLIMGGRVWGIDPESPTAYEAMAEARRTETAGKAETDFLKPFMHRIVGLGMVGLDLAKKTVSVVSRAGEDEAEYIRQFHLMLAGGPVLVSWNGLAFDLAVLRYRALYHRLPLPQLYGTSLRNFDRYEYRFGERHFDLMDLLSGYGRSAALTLREMAALLELPCKTEASGEDVLALFRAGEYGRIKRYVNEDCSVTARIFLQWWVNRGSARWGELEGLYAQLAPFAEATA